MPELERLRRDVVGAQLQRRSRGRCSRRIERMAAVAHGRSCRRSRTPARPREIEGRNIYLCSPEYMASYARRFINNGVRLVGGCCGTTPEHIRHIKAAVRALASPAARWRRRGAGGRAPVTAAAPLVEPVPRAEKSRMANGAGARRVRRQRRAGAAARVPRRRARRAGAAAAGSTASISSTFRTVRAPARG